MNTKEAIQFLERQQYKVTSSMRDDDIFNKIIALLQQGEKYRQIWEVVKIWERNDVIMVKRNIDEIEQKYFPKEASQDYKEGGE